MLGYTDMKTFEKIINKATKALLSLNIPHYDNIIAQQREIDRILIREVFIEVNKSLFSTAKKAGVDDYAEFKNAGNLGKYNITAWELEKRRDVAKWKLMDNMGRTELTANLFRVTRAEERIKNKKIIGQRNL